MTDKDLTKGMYEKLESDRNRQDGVCLRCDYVWSVPDGHGECFDWQAIELYEAWKEMYNEWLKPTPAK